MTSILSVQIRKNFVPWLLVFMTSLGCVSSVFTIGSFKVNLFIFLLIMTDCALIATFVVLLKQKKEQFAIEVLPPDIDDKKKLATIVFPCTMEIALKATYLGKDIFGDDDVGFDIFKKWLSRNPFITTSLLDKEGKFAGYFTILPLETEFAKKYFNTCDFNLEFEKQIPCEAILTPEHMKESEYLYFSSIAVKNCHTFTGQVHASMLFWTILKHLSIFYNSSIEKHIFAVPTTDCGEALVKKLGFKLSRECSYVVNHHDLFERVFSKHQIKELLHTSTERKRNLDYSALSNYCK